MERYFKRKASVSIEGQNIDRKKSSSVDVVAQDERDIQVNSDNGNESNHRGESDIGHESDVIQDESDVVRDESGVRNETDVQGKIDVTQLPTDPGLRIPIIKYHVNVRDEVRRAYIQMGPCQPSKHKFPQKNYGKSSLRRFQSSWFDEFPSWLEYSIAKDATFCFYCYLFKSSVERGGGDTFVERGFSNWKRKEKLQEHVGNHNSAHNKSRIECEAFLNQEKNIQAIFLKQSQQSRNDYRIRLGASVDCVRFLLRQGLAFRGHDESEDSNNQGNFLKLLHFLADHNEEIKTVTFKNAPENLKLTSPDIQKDIVSVAAFETISVIIKDIGNSLFSILVDESRDISVKEQMSIFFHYVNKTGCVVERFIGIEHVSNTKALALKAAIDNLFSRYKLSISSLRGQSYDGASNMQGKFNGLKALILKENPSAFYIHCFAHQLQLALVAVANKHVEIEAFFDLVDSVVNIVGGSAKRCDLLQEKQRLRIVEALNHGELSSGRGLNKQTTLKRSGDTRWSSHYNSLINFIQMFSPTIDVLETIAQDVPSSGKRGEARNLLTLIVRFDFAFSLHLMKRILGISNELSKALQRKDQDIVNAMKLVKICKEQLQAMRDNGWDSFLETVCSFCRKQHIDIPNMDAIYIPPGRSRRNAPEMTNLHHLRVDYFYAVIDMQLQELNDRFSEVNSELCLCIACLCPDDSFSSFDKNKLIRLGVFYPEDFSLTDLFALDDQLETYIFDMRTDENFRGLRGLSDLAKKLVVTKKNEVYPLIYRLVTLALILPVATATVERVFSAMNLVKTRLRNRIGDQWLNDSLVVYIENDIFNEIDNDLIIRHFQNMKTRREQL